MIQEIFKFASEGNADETYAKIVEQQDSEVMDYLGLTILARRYEKAQLDDKAFCGITVMLVEESLDLDLDDSINL